MNVLHIIYAGISSLSRKILNIYLTFLHTRIEKFGKLNKKLV